MMMSPFTPLRTQNISAWMCAKCDPEDYGQLLVYRFPRGVNVNGPQQIIGEAKQNPDVSKFETLLGQRGSKVIFGNLLVIPTDSSLLYAIPIYVQASGPGAATIPAIQQVILATGNRVVMRPTLDEAVAALVRVPAPANAAEGPGTAEQLAQPQPTGGPTTVPELIRRMKQAYQGARAKQQEYNKSLDDLGRALNDLQRSLNQGTPPQTHR